VDVGVKVLRHVVVYNVRDPLYVDTTRGDIRCDKDSVTTILESVQCLLALSLRKVSMERGHMLTTPRELLSETLRGVLHLGEHNHESLSVLLQPVRQNVRL
jgi:hypothetical protein